MRFLYTTILTTAFRVGVLLMFVGSVLGGCVGVPNSNNFQHGDYVMNLALAHAAPELAH